MAGRAAVCFSIVVLMGAACGDVDARPQRSLRVASATRWSEGAALSRDVPRADNAEAHESAPVALTASDGTGLELVAYRARAALEGPLALTELHLVFRNPRPRVIEGRFSITLPTGASISRLAMRLPQGWQEAEVVERQAARQAYEDFLHRKQDPALLEREAGNRFRARIFPIPARGVKEIKVAYTQELQSAEAPYRLHLRGLPVIERLEVEVLQRGRRVTASRRNNHRPTRDVIVHGSAAVAGLRSGNLVAARIKPRMSNARAELKRLLVLVDTSASRALGLATQAKRLGRLLDALRRVHGDEVALQMACFDQQVVEIFEGTIAGLQAEHLGRIVRRGALGASDFERALRWAKGRRADRLLLVTDGVATAGAVQGAALRKALAALRPQYRRLDVALVGGIRDEAAMKALVRGVLRDDGVIVDFEHPADRLARRLSLNTVSGIRVAVPGARWVWPHRLDGVQGGDEFLIYADLPAEKLPADLPLRVALSGGLVQERAVKLSEVERPLLERAWVRARIARAQHLRQTRAADDPELRAALRKQIVQLSTRYRVLSDYTALLVLETEADYARFGIDRRALADILTVGRRGVTLLHRTSPPPRSASLARQRRAGGEAVQWLRKRGPDHRGEEGKMGRPRQPRSARRLAADPAAANAGVLGVLRGSGERSLPTVFGSDPAPGRDAEDALGGLVGNQVGEAHGYGGLGLRGTGRGGGGRGEGTIGLGRLGTIGRGGGGGTGRGYGSLRPRRRARAPRVLAGRAVVRGALDKEIIRRIVRRHINEVKYCYQRELQADRRLRGRVTINFTIDESGQVFRSGVASSTLNHRAVEDCIARAVGRWRFPMPRGGGIVVVNYPFVLRAADGGTAVGTRSRSRSRARRAAVRTVVRRPPTIPPATRTYDGRMKQVMARLEGGEVKAAFAAALRWHDEQPGDVLALVALGQTLVALGRAEQAARAYGSIIDLFSSRADMRRFAGGRLESVGEAGRALAADSYAKAAKQRPDHPNSHRLLAYAQLQLGQLERAFATLEKGLKRRYPDGRFRGVQRVMREDLGLVAAAWIARDPKRRAEVQRRIEALGAKLARRRSTRFVLSWETDANDVDLHVHDGAGRHAYYQRPELGSGGALYADVTTGYGPECFTIRGRPRAFPYRLRAHYYARGPMGYGMGTLQVIQHDGRGGLRFAHRPFVVMNDGAYVELGRFERPL